MSEKHIIGVDGGGTKTVTRLATLGANGDAQVIGAGTAGSSNVRSVGWDQGMANLESSMHAAWEDAGVEVSPVDVAVLALAGSGQADMRERMLRWANENQIALHIEIIHDAFAALIAGTEAGWGVVLVAGTGSVAFAKNQRGEEQVTGGWGYRFGDEGSGYWIGQTALRAVSQAVDKRGPQTSLTDAILEHLQITDPREILSALAATGDERTAVAALSGLVVQNAEQSDAVATEIVEEGATHLANLVSSCAEKCELGKSYPLVLAGGVLCASPLICDLLSEKLKQRGVAPPSMQMCPEPVEGCLQLASKIGRDS